MTSSAWKLHVKQAPWVPCSARIASMTSLAVCVSNVCQSFCACISSLLLLADSLASDSQRFSNAQNFPAGFELRGGKVDEGFPSDAGQQVVIAGSKPSCGPGNDDNAQTPECDVELPAGG